MSGLSQRVLGVVSGGTEVPFGSITRRYNISHTTVRRQMRHVVSVGIVIKSNCRVGPGVLNCGAYACVNMGLRQNSVCGSIIPRFRGVPRIIRYRFAAKPCAVLVGLCTHSGRRLVRLLGTRVRRVPNIATARALVSLHRDMGHRVPVYSVSRWRGVRCVDPTSGRLPNFFVYRAVCVFTRGSGTAVSGCLSVLFLYYLPA